MKMSDDLYEILGVSRDASDEAIRKAYRKLAREHHPDLNPGDEAAEARFKRLSAAYEVLSDSDKRALFDEFGADAEKIGYDPERAAEYREWKHRAEAAAGFGGFPGGMGGAGGGARYADIEDLLGDLFGQRGPRRGSDVEARLAVRFEDAARGATTSIELPRPRSDGSVELKHLEVSIPAGIDSGQRLRLAGQGRPGHEGGPAGDLYVQIEVQPHHFFSRDGLDLSLDLPITLVEALRGGAAEVPTLSGSVKLKIPPGASNGQKMRLRGKGIATPRATGDLYVTLDLVMPEGGDTEERARIASELEALYAGQDVRKELHR